MQKKVQVAGVTFSNELPFALIAGPCQMESASHGLEMAESLVALTKKLDIPFIFKASPFLSTKRITSFQPFRFRLIPFSLTKFRA